MLAVYSDVNHPVKESDLTRPESNCGISKLASELFLSSSSELNHFSTTVLRLFNVYGRNQKYNSKVGVITILINKILRNEEPVLYESGNQIRDFIHVDDVIQALIRVK